MNDERKKRATLPGRVIPDELKLKPGRKRKEPPANAADLIRAAAATGANQRGVAAALSVNTEVLIRWLAEHPELEEAFKQGREKERQTLHNVLYDAATQGSGKESLIAAMFLLKARHGYREGEQEVQQNRVNINFQLPGARPMSEYVIEAENAEPRVERLPAARS